MFVVWKGYILPRVKRWREEEVERSTGKEIGRELGEAPSKEREPGAQLRHVAARGRAGHGDSRARSQDVLGLLRVFCVGILARTSTGQD